MNRLPPLPPDQRLDAEERALAALLPRPHGRTEPRAELDAGILAAARAATQPVKAKPVPVRRRSWIAPTAVAASLMLAVGLAWQLRPPPSPDAATSTPAAAGTGAAPDAGNDALVARAFETSPPPAAAAAMPPSEQMKPAARFGRPAAPAKVASVVAAPVAPAEPAAAMAAPPPPAPPPAPAPVVADSPAAAPSAEARMAAPARAAAPALAKSDRSGDGAREQRASAAGNAAAQAQDAAERAAADAAALDTVTVAGSEEPDEDVPPATADSPEVRDAWLRRIGELLKQGRHDDAKASLAEFRRRYPEATLPPDLRKLEH